jgi:hypothetical protein
MCSKLLNVRIISIENYQERVSQQPRERRKRDQEGKLQEVEFRARSRWRMCLLTAPPNLDVIRTVEHPPPLFPPSHPYPILDTQRPQRWTSVMALVWRLWVQKLISDSYSDCFLLLPIFYRRPVSRDIDCYILAKISEILVGVDSNICDDFCMAGRHK